jgi:hypothetical protein
MQWVRPAGMALTIRRVPPWSVSSAHARGASAGSTTLRLIRRFSKPRCQGSPRSWYHRWSDAHRRTRPSSAREARYHPYSQAVYSMNKRLDSDPYQCMGVRPGVPMVMACLPGVGGRCHLRPESQRLEVLGGADWLLCSQSCRPGHSFNRIRTDESEQRTHSELRM